jgi:hypothetical protein
MQDKDQLIAKLKDKLSECLEMSIGEVNDQPLRDNIVKALQDFLSKSSAKDYVVICDESNNSEEAVHCGWLTVSIAVKSTEDNDWIHVPGMIRPELENFETIFPHPGGNGSMLESLPDSLFIKNPQ